VLVLLGAVVLLTCAVCARSGDKPAAGSAAPQVQNAAPGDGAPDAAPAQQPEPPVDRQYFPATKAPGFLIDR
jgi:hypothetical protein